MKPEPDKQHVFPAITGNPYSLRRPGQSGGEAFVMWTGFLLAYWVSRFSLLVTIGLALYPMALVANWLLLLYQRS